MPLWYQFENPRWHLSQVIVFKKSSGKQTSDLSLEVRVTKFQSDPRFALDGVKLKILFGCQCSFFLLQKYIKWVLDIQLEFVSMPDGKPPAFYTLKPCLQVTQWKRLSPLPGNRSVCEPLPQKPQWWGWLFPVCYCKPGWQKKKKKGVVRSDSGFNSAQ